MSSLSVDVSATSWQSFKPHLTAIVHEKSLSWKFSSNLKGLPPLIVTIAQKSANCRFWRYCFEMIAEREQISMRYSQRRWLFLTWTLNLWNFLLLLTVGAGSFTWVRRDRTDSWKKKTLAPTNTSKSHLGLKDPTPSIVRDSDCSKDMYSAVNTLSLPMHLLKNTILFSFPLRKHLQKGGRKGKQVKKGKTNEKKE